MSTTRRGPGPDTEARNGNTDGAPWMKVAPGDRATLARGAGAGRQRARLPALLSVLLLAACASRSPLPVTPGAAQWPGRDGAESRPPPDLMQVPDAEPRIEPLREGGPNKPYEVFGQRYEPALGDPVMVERGLASWYGRKFHGRATASGERYDMYAMTAAHRTMPLPSYARVRNPANDREVVVRVNDRGPFHPERLLDLSYTAAARLGLLGGVAPVEIERITFEAIRSGSWRRPAGATALAGVALPMGDAADPIAEIVRRVAPATPGARPGWPAEPSRAAEAARRADVAAPTDPAARAAGPGFWLQLGAFTERDAAARRLRQVQQRAGWLAPLLAIFDETGLHRLQAGPYASRDQALAMARRVREALQLDPLIVDRR